MILGLDLLGQSLFALPNSETAYDPHQPWSEVCKEETKWQEIDIPKGTIDRCEDGN